MEIEKALDIIAEADLKVVKTEPNVLRFPAMGMDPKKLRALIDDAIEEVFADEFVYIEDVRVEGAEVVVIWERGRVSKKRMKESIRDSVEEHMNWATGAEKRYGRVVVDCWPDSFKKAM